MADIDLDITDLAANQHGLVARFQLRSLGIDPGAIVRRLARGTLVARSSRVLQVAGSPETEASALLGAVLDVGPGACVSHESAAALWDLPGFEARPISVTGPRPRTRSVDLLAGVAHRPRRLRQGDVVELDRIPVTTPTRTIFDLAGSRTVHAGRLERLLDTAWARGLVSHASLHSALGDLGTRGRPGIALMRELLAARPAAHRPPESGTEARFQELARRCGFGGFERQVDVGGEMGWIGRVDFIDRAKSLVVEIDSARYHASLTDRRHDAQRHTGLAGAGFRVVTFTDHEVFHRPEVIEERLRRPAA